MLSSSIKARSKTGKERRRHRIRWDKQLRFTMVIFLRIRPAHSAPSLTTASSKDAGQHLYQHHTISRKTRTRRAGFGLSHTSDTDRMKTKSSNQRKRPNCQKPDTPNSKIAVNIGRSLAVSSDPKPPIRNPSPSTSSTFAYYDSPLSTATTENDDTGSDATLPPIYGKFQALLPQPATPSLKASPKRLTPNLSDISPIPIKYLAPYILCPTCIDAPPGNITLDATSDSLACSLCRQDLPNPALSAAQATAIYKTLHTTTRKLFSLSDKNTMTEDKSIHGDAMQDDEPISIGKAAQIEYELTERIQEETSQTFIEEFRNAIAQQNKRIEDQNKRFLEFSASVQTEMEKMNNRFTTQGAEIINMLKNIQNAPPQTSTPTPNMNAHESTRQDPFPRLPSRQNHTSSPSPPKVIPWEDFEEMPEGTKKATKTRFQGCRRGKTIPPLPPLLKSFHGKISRKCQKEYIIKTLH